MIAFVLCVLLYIVDKVTYIVVKHGRRGEIGCCRIVGGRALLVFRARQIRSRSRLSAADPPTPTPAARDDELSSEHF
jgi:hypothetical protein